MGNFVIFSPSFDSPFKELGNAVGQTIRESSSLHLITQHGTDLAVSRRYSDQPYLDFCGVQSGAGSGGEAAGDGHRRPQCHRVQPCPLPAATAQAGGQPGSPATTASSMRTDAAPASKLRILEPPERMCGLYLRHGGPVQLGTNRDAQRPAGHALGLALRHEPPVLDGHECTWPSSSGAGLVETCDPHHDQSWCRSGLHQSELPKNSAMCIMSMRTGGSWRSASPRAWPAGSCASWLVPS